jgi:hypothetical protein
LHVCNGLNIHTRTLVLHACMDYRHWVAFSEGRKIHFTEYLSCCSVIYICCGHAASRDVKRPFAMRRDSAR